MEAAFRKFDRDRNGRLDKLEITNALREGGFHFNPATANTLMRKFATGGAATTGGCTAPSFPSLSCRGLTMDLIKQRTRSGQLRRPPSTSRASSSSALSSVPAAAHSSGPTAVYMHSY